MIMAGIQQLLVEYGWPLGEQVGTRVYPITLPEAPALPAVTYQIVGGSSDPGFTNSGPQRLRVQFDCYADQKSGGYRAAYCVRDDLRKLLNGFSGELPNGDYLQSALLIQNIDYFENDARQYRLACEFYIDFNFMDEAFAPSSGSSGSPGSSGPIAALILQDAVSGQLYSITYANGARTITPVSSGTPATSYTLIDASTGLYYSLEMASGAFEVVEVSSSVPGVASIQFTDTATSATVTLAMVSGALTTS
jgi:hypothetical protein